LTNIIILADFDGKLKIFLIFDLKRLKFTQRDFVKQSAVGAKVERLIAKVKRKKAENS
jgi:hypothetical protein